MTLLISENSFYCYQTNLEAVNFNIKNSSFRFIAFYNYSFFSGFLNRVTGLLSEIRAFIVIEQNLK